MLSTLKKKKMSGFTLVEMLISIAVFGIVAITMTGIILSIASISYTVDRRNDFLNAIELATNNIKNEMRNAASMGKCSNNSLFVIKKPKIVNEGQPVQESYQLTLNQQNQLVWQKLNSINSNGDCTVSNDDSIEIITSESLRIQNLNINLVKDSSNKNTLVFVSFEACDSASVPRKIFICDRDADNYSPYRHMFAISTRNL